jgi:hypothetical protein
MSNLFNKAPWRTMILNFANVGIATQTSVASFFTYGSSGTAVSLRFSSPVTSTLVDVYFFVTSLIGTGGTVTVTLRTASASGFVPSNTILATTSVVTNVANKWYKATFSVPSAITLGINYFVLFTANNSSNGPNIVSNSPLTPATDHLPICRTVTTTNGFSTSVQANAMPFILAFGDGSVIGCPFATAAVSDTSNTLERGLKILGFDAPIVISGIAFTTAATLVNVIKIYSVATPPGGTPLFSQTVLSGDAANGGISIAPFTLQANTAYRIVMGFSAASTAPGALAIADYTTYAALLDSVSPYGTHGMHYTIDNGAGGWTDSPDKHPKLALLIAQQISGGGSFVG